MKNILTKKTLTNPHNILSFLIIVFSILVSLYYLDAFHVRYPNNRVNLSEEEIKSHAKDIIMRCKDPSKTNPQECYKEKLISVTKTYGISTSHKILISLQDSEPLTQNCHVLAHYMSREAYLRSERDFYNLIDNVDISACGGGFLHGVLETYIAKNETILDENGIIKSSFTNEVCGRGENTYKQLACAHLMGHIFLLNTYGSIQEALPSCANLRAEWQYICYDGLFMEDHQKLMLAEHGISPSVVLNKEYIASMEKECNTHTGLAGMACWKEMAEMYAHTYGYDPKIIYEGCLRAPNEESKNECYFKGVEVMAPYTYGFDTKEKLLLICSFYENKAHYSDCTSRIMLGIVFNSFKLVPRGVTLCKNVNPQYKEQCFDSLVFMLRNAFVVGGTQERYAVCKLLDAPYDTKCAN